MRMSIITATYNCEKVVGGLIESLLNQADDDFEWIVADGGSTDRTLEIIEQYKQRMSIKVITGPDFGIYDGLNKAIELAEGDFYLVAGADDTLDENSILNFKTHMNDEVSIITTSNVKFGFLKRYINKFDFLSPMKKYVYGHSVYTCFRTALHRKYGLYSKRYPIAADLLFIRLCALNGERIKVCSFRPGHFSSEGVSGKDKLGALSETMRVQVETGTSEFLALSVFFLRVMWFRAKGLGSVLISSQHLR